MASDTSQPLAAGRGRGSGVVCPTWFFANTLDRHTLCKQLRCGKAQAQSIHCRGARQPFLFTFEAKDFVLQEADNRPIIGFDRLFVDFQLSSLFRWAWTFADVRIERPSLHVEIQHNGRLNFADLADSLPKSEDPPPTDSRPPRMLVHHAEVVDGSFTFSDRSDTTHAQKHSRPSTSSSKRYLHSRNAKVPTPLGPTFPAAGGWLAR